jgi:hypothetical protein
MDLIVNMVWSSALRRRPRPAVGLLRDTGAAARLVNSSRQVFTAAQAFALYFMKCEAGSAVGEGPLRVGFTLANVLL